ncbi:MAG: cation:proton antiporter [Candidatus Eisenbacteria bacterium]|nr:cation:proton antiporter [Candidatus Eisenbacteria bacterium]
MQEIFRAEPFLLLGLIVLAGFYFGRAAQLARLPSLIGFMVLGVVLGPSALGLFYEGNLESLSFITEIALGFVAFSIGAELNLKSLAHMGKGIVSIILAESFGAFFVVMLVVYLISRSWPLALLFGAVAPASAPAGTVAVIQEYRAKGKLTTALYAVVGFDDGLAILIFGFAAALAKNMLGGILQVGNAGGGVLSAMGQPAIEIVVSLAVGTALGFVLGILLRKLHAGRDTLIMVFGTVFVATGISIHFGLSLILTNMAVGFVLANTRREAFLRRATDPLREIMPLLFILFFCLAGAHLKLSELPKLGVIGISYVLARSAGLIGGSRLGGEIVHMEDRVRKWIGLGILSQAGVAIGLSLIVSSEFSQMAGDPNVVSAVARYAAANPGASKFLYDPMAIGAAIITVITATSIIFEIVGPILTKVALTRADEIGKDESL